MSTLEVTVSMLEAMPEEARAKVFGPNRPRCERSNRNPA